jgi:hypothetical protein
MTSRSLTEDEEFEMFHRRMIVGFGIVLASLGTVAQTNTFPSSGNVGIGTTSPGNTLEVMGGQPGLFWNGTNGYFNSVEGHSVVIRDESTTNDYWWISLAPYSSSTPGVDFLGGGANPAGARVSFWTNVGIGTRSPAYTLDVSGSIHATGAINASSGVTFSDGTTQTTAFNSTLCGGDYAESVDVSGKRKGYAPGDVLILTQNGNSDVTKSNQAYSRLVAGIFSTKPGAIGRRQAVPKSLDEVPMAMIGIVPTKVSAENGPIHRGDLLVTSSTAGYAMKGTDMSKMLGAVLGKAMGSLESGKGVIEVLVTLQ